MDLSIIIINYKSAQLVLDCLHTVYAQTKQCAFEVLLVDNDSKDDCQLRVADLFPQVQWLQMGYNAGFARANNAGIRVAKGKYVLLLNADTLVLDGAIDRAIELMEQLPETVGAGVQLLNTDGSHQISGAHFMKGGLNTLLPLPYLGRFIRYWGYRFKSTVPSVEHVEQDIAVDWIVGAFMLIRKTAIDKAGLLDEDFFMYAEEIEWCARLRKQGNLYLFATPKIIHIGGGTSGDYYQTTEGENSKNLWNRKGRQIMVSNMLRIRKQFGIGWFILIVGVYVVEVPIFAACLAIDRLFHRQQAKYSWKNVGDYSANIGVLCSHFFQMLRNRPHFYKTN